MLRRIRQRGLLYKQLVTGPGIGFSPDRRHISRSVQIFDQSLDLLATTQNILVAKHLAGRATIGYHLDGFSFFQAAQALRQQRRTQSANPLLAMTHRTMLLILRIGLLIHRHGRHLRQCQKRCRNSRQQSCSGHRVSPAILSHTVKDFTGHCLDMNWLKRNSPQHKAVCTTSHLMLPCRYPCIMNARLMFLHGGCAHANPLSQATTGQTLAADF